MYFVVIPWSPRFRGGVSVVVQQLTKQWGAVGVRCETFVDDWDASTPLVRDGEHRFAFRFIAEPFSPFGLLKTLSRTPLVLWRTHRLLRLHGCTGVNFHYPGLNATGVAALKALGFFKGRLVLSFHGTDVRRPNTTLERHIWSFILSQCDAVTTCSAALRIKLLEALPVDAAKTAVAYNGVDQKVFHARSQPASPSACHLVSLGSYTPGKGHRTLLQAIAMLANEAQHPGLRLTIAGGDGSELTALKILARDLGITDRVRFLTNLDTEAVVNLLRGARLLVQPSLAEAFGLAVIEAGATGVPVVVSAVGGHLEIVENGRTGWTFPAQNADACRDAIAEALAHPDEASRRSQSLMNEVGMRFSWPRFACQIDDILSGVKNNELK